MKYTLGEKLGILKPKPEPEPRPVWADEGDKWSEPCSCGSGQVEYTYHNGSWIPTYSAWDGGKDFGKLSMVACCEACSRKEP